VRRQHIKLTCRFETLFMFLTVVFDRNVEGTIICVQPIHVCSQSIPQPFTGHLGRVLPGTARPHSVQQAHRVLIWGHGIDRPSLESRCSICLALVSDRGSSQVRGRASSSSSQ
jgi:hypothetical protein